MEKDFDTNSSIFSDQIACLDSNLRYFFIQKCSYSVWKKQQVKQKPIFLVYKESIINNIDGLIDLYKKRMKIDLNKDIQFQLSGGTALSNQTTFQNLRNTIGRQSLDGITFYSVINKSSFNDECAVSSLEDIQKSLDPDKYLDITVLLPVPKQYLYVKFDRSDNLVSLKGQVSSQIFKKFGKDLNIKHFDLLIVRGEKQDIVTSYILSKFSNKVSLKLVFLNGIVLPPMIIKNNRQLIIKRQGTQPRKYCFEQYMMMRVKQFLKDVVLVPQPEFYGLKVNDLVLKPIDILNKASILFKSQLEFSAYIVADLIDQRQIFYLEVPKIFQISKQKLDLEKIIDKQQLNKNLRQQCERKSEKRAQKAPHPPLVNNKNLVHPILVYTSQLKCTINGIKKPLYKILNQTFRATKFINITDQEYQNSWQYLYSSQLVNILKYITPKQGKSYRGVGFEFSYQIGEIINYPQFTSSSQSKQVALNFATSMLFVIKHKSGKPIYHYSYYENQYQILFEPYTQFRVVGESQQYNSHSGLNIKQPPVPGNCVTKLIFWLDGVIKEGQMIWNNLKNIKKSCMFLQMIYTNDLEQWLNRYKNIFETGTIQPVLITNMRRNQKNGVFNQEAGIDAIQMFRKFAKNGQIAMYVGDIDITVKKLKEKGITNIPVFNSPGALTKYLDNLI